MAIADRLLLLSQAVGSKLKSMAGLIDPNGFYKLDSTSPAFSKTGPSSLVLKAGTSINLGGVSFKFEASTAVVMPTLVGGTDYAIYACSDGTIRADSSWSYPSGYDTSSSRKIGGFHYGLVAPGTTLTGDAGFPITGNGMIWAQADIDLIAGINSWSIWDLKYRPVAPDPRGMALVGGRTWVDIYLCNPNTDANGTSKAGTPIASSTVYPHIPSWFGGNGTSTYSSLNWWVANELARAHQKRLITASEFFDAAFGVTENTSLDNGSSTYPTTQRNPGFTSKYGIEQASGVQLTWGADSAGAASSWGSNGGRGASYNRAITHVVLGGARGYGGYSGSRCANWSFTDSYANWAVGLRAACDHLQVM